MDFEVLPEIQQAVHDYADHLVYGYTYASEELIKAVLDWERDEHGYAFDRDALVFIEGVVPAISTAIQAFTKEGDAVLINTLFTRLLLALSSSIIDDLLPIL